MDTLPSDYQLQVGDVCVLVGLVIATHKNGNEVTIVGPARLARFRDTITRELSEIELRYPTSERDADGRPIHYRACNLRKKRPPREDLQIVRWDQCPWQPDEVRA
jgi:hypothetical protein